MHIAQITYSLNIGGLEKLVTDLAKNLVGDGIQVSVYCLSNELTLLTTLTEANVQVFSIPKRKGVDFRLFGKLRKLLVENKVDLVHTHNVGAWIYGGIAALLAGKKVIHTEHSNVFAHQNRLILSERVLSNFTSVIIGDSKKVRDHLVFQSKLPESKIETVFNGIDTDIFRDDGTRSLRKTFKNIAEHDIVIGTVARLAAVKNQETMLEALKILTKRMPNIKLLMIGDGPQKNALNAKATELNISDKVLFLGEREDIPQLLNCLDIFILTSLSEGLPLSVLEAMASCLPVISTRVGAIPEVVREGETGFLIEPKCPEALADAIERLATNPELRIAMGKKGRQRVIEEFSLKQMVDQYKKIYAQKM